MKRATGSPRNPGQCWSGRATGTRTSLFLPRALISLNPVLVPEARSEENELHEDSTSSPLLRRSASNSSCVHILQRISTFVHVRLSSCVSATCPACPRLCRTASTEAPFTQLAASALDAGLPREDRLNGSSAQSKRKAMRGVC
jgi:hypothetical protein